MKIYEGNFNGKGKKFGIVVSRWNSFITERLKEGAIDALVRHGVDPVHIEIAYCPGAYEVPLTAQWLAAKQKPDAIITIGAVIRGSTPHFDYVCSAVNKGVADLNMTLGIPVLFGILTTDSIEQAVERAGTKAGNKGFEVATAALEMVSLKDEMK